MTILKSQQKKFSKNCDFFQQFSQFSSKISTIIKQQRIIEFESLFFSQNISKLVKFKSIHLKLDTSVTVE